jgi:hypothetical protein
MNNKKRSNIAYDKAEALLSRLSGVRATGHGKWMAHCPAHDDKSPSLAVRDAGGKILIHCFAGCPVYDVVTAVGLTLSDLMPHEPATHQRGQVSRLSAYEAMPRMIEAVQVIYEGMAKLRLGYALSAVDLVSIDKSMGIINDIRRCVP